MISTNSAPKLFRKRIIPSECVALKNDEILYFDDEIIVTKWNALKPKPDLHHGYSCYFHKYGIKVSKFLLEDDSLLYWYCDIVEEAYDEASNSYTFTDLLADVVIYPDGSVKVIDLDEIAEAIEKKLLSEGEICNALRTLNSFLTQIYTGEFDYYKSKIEQFI